MDRLLKYFLALHACTIDDLYPSVLEGTDSLCCTEHVPSVQDPRNDIQSIVQLSRNESVLSYYFI